MELSIANDFLKQGFLQHFSGTLGQSWKERYFVLTPNELSIFKDQTLKSKLDTVSLASIGTVAMKPDKNGKTHVFQITTTHDLYILSAEDANERDAWSKAILAAKHNNPVSGAQKMVYSRAPQDFTPERAESYYMHLGSRLMAAENLHTLKECYICIASWISRTYNESTIPNMSGESVKLLLDTLLKSANEKKKQAFMAGLWNEGIEESYYEVTSTVSHAGYLVLKQQLSNVMKTDIENPAARGVPQTDFYSKYSKKAHLGSGSFGSVYEAEHIETKKRFAAKILNKKKMSKNDLKFVSREVQSMALVVHPNFIYLEQCYETRNEFIIVMEIANGVCLSDEAANHQDWGEVDILNIMKVLVTAIKYLHGVGLAHRDLKPENVLFTHTGQLKIGDFGFAKKISDGLVTGCGSPLYMAPEVLYGEKYTEKCDIWSLGVIMYELLAGFVPFNDTTQERLFRKIQAGNIKFPSPFWDYASDYSKELLVKMICVDPKQRYSAAKVLENRWFKEGDKLMKKEQKVKKYLKTFNDTSNKILKRGYLSKKGSVIPRWIRKSFALYSDRLVYTKDETSTEFKGDFKLADISNVTAGLESPESLQIVFKNKKIFTIKCDTDEEANIWRDKILSARRCWSLLDLAKQAFNSQRYNDALENLVECRQNPHMFSNIDAVNLWRYISWKCIKTSCAAIWNLTSYYLPKSYVACMKTCKLGGEEIIICGCNGGVVQSINTSTNRKNDFKCNDGGDVLSVAVQEATSILVSVGSNGSICYWDLNTMKIVHTSKIYQEKINALDVAQNRPIAVTGVESGLLDIWDINNHSSIKKFEKVGNITCIAISLTFIIVCVKKKIIIYDLNKYEIVTKLKGHDGYIHAVGVYPRGDIIVTGGVDKQLFVWNLKEGKQINKMRAPKNISANVEHDEAIRSVDISSDGKWCVSSAEDGKIIIWNVETGFPEALCIMDGYSKSVIFSNDTNCIISAKSRFVENWFVDWVLAYKDIEYPPPVWVQLK